MAYLVNNICTKNYWNRTTIVEIIVGGWVVSFFETQCIFRKPKSIWILQTLFKYLFSTGIQIFEYSAIWLQSLHYIYKCGL